MPSYSGPSITLQMDFFPFKASPAANTSMEGTLFMITLCLLSVILLLIISCTGISFPSRMDSMLFTVDRAINTLMEGPQISTTLLLLAYSEDLNLHKIISIIYGGTWIPLNLFLISNMPLGADP